jgi:hypothetical protein
MKSNLDQLLQQRQTVLRDMQAIDRLRRGCLSQQFFRSKAKPTTKLGPYFVLQGFFQGKKVSERIPEDQVSQVRQDVDNYRRFQALAEGYVTLSDQITQIQDSQPTDNKKNSSRRRSPMNGSRKPPPS